MLSAWRGAPRRALRVSQLARLDHGRADAAQHVDLVVAECAACEQVPHTRHQFFGVVRVKEFHPDQGFLPVFHQLLHALAAGRLRARVGLAGGVGQLRAALCLEQGVAQFPGRQLQCL